MSLSIFDVKPAFTNVCRQAAAGLRDECDKRFMRELPDVIEELAVLSWFPGPLDLDAEISVYAAVAIILCGSARVTEALDFRTFYDCLEEELGKQLPPPEEVPEWVRRTVSAFHLDCVEGPVYRYKEELEQIRPQKHER